MREGIAAHLRFGGKLFAETAIIGVNQALFASLGIFEPHQSRCGKRILAGIAGPHRDQVVFTCGTAKRVGEIGIEKVRDDEHNRTPLLHLVQMIERRRQVRTGVFRSKKQNVAE